MKYDLSVILRRGFERVNAKVRDWNHWCSLEEFRPHAWEEAVLEELQKSKDNQHFAELWSLTHLAFQQFNLAQRAYVEPTEFDAILGEMTLLLQGEEAAK
jgi:hypothetical protein